jgi:hypothetical protein
MKALTGPLRMYCLSINVSSLEANNGALYFAGPRLLLEARGGSPITKIGIPSRTCERRIASPHRQKHKVEPNFQSHQDPLVKHRNAVHPCAALRIKD